MERREQQWHWQSWSDLLVAVLQHQKDVQHLARPDQSLSNTIYKKEYQYIILPIWAMFTLEVYLYLGLIHCFGWVMHPYIEDLVWRFWKIFSLFLLIMKRHFRILWSLFLINEHFFHMDVPHFSRYCQIFHSSKKPPYTKPQCCYLLYKAPLLQQYCSTVQCEPPLKLVGVISEDAGYPMVERLTTYVWLPPSSRQPHKVWLGRCYGQVCQRLNYQQLRDSALQWQFSFSAWPQAPFLKWTQASSCPWT